MKHHLRRAANAYPFFKLAAWDAVSFCWRDGKRQYESEQAAREDAQRPGRYRLSRIDDARSPRVDLAEFQA
jgi:hypothetical protein